MKNLIIFTLSTIIILLIMYIILLQNYLLDIEENILNISIISNNVENISIKPDIDTNNKFIFPKYLNLFNLLSETNSHKTYYVKSFFLNSGLNHKYILFDNLSSRDKLEICVSVLKRVNITNDINLLQDAINILEESALIHLKVLDNINAVLN